MTGLLGSVAAKLAGWALASPATSLLYGALLARAVAMAVVRALFGHTQWATGDSKLVTALLGRYRAELVVSDAQPERLLVGLLDAGPLSPGVLVALAWASFAAPVERRIGSARTLLLYLAPGAVLLAVHASLIDLLGVTSYLAGAWIGLATVQGADLVVVHRERARRYLAWLRVLGLFGTCYVLTGHVALPIVGWVIGAASTLWWTRSGADSTDSRWTFRVAAAALVAACFVSAGRAALAPLSVAPASWHWHRAVSATAAGDCDRAGQSLAAIERLAGYREWHDAAKRMRHACGTFDAEPNASRRQSPGGSEPPGRP